MSPNFFTTLRSNFLKVSAWVPSSYQIDQQLYTTRGSYSMIMGDLFWDYLNLRNVDSSFIFRITNATAQFPNYYYALMKPMAFVVSSPAAFFSNYPTDLVQDALVSFPTYQRLSQGTFKSTSNVPIETLFFEIKSGYSESQVNAFKKRLSLELSGTRLRVRDLEDELAPLNIAVRAMNFFFLFITVITMTMCFFSLFSSMYTNVYQQAKVCVVFVILTIL